MFKEGIAFGTRSFSRTPEMTPLKVRPCGECPQVAAHFVHTKLMTLDQTDYPQRTCERQKCIQYSFTVVENLLFRSTGFEKHEVYSSTAGIKWFLKPRLCFECVKNVL